MTTAAVQQADELARYTQYSALLSQAGILPKTLDAWTADYQERAEAGTSVARYSLNIEKFEDSPWQEGKWHVLRHEFRVPTSQGDQHYLAKLIPAAKTGERAAPEHLGKPYEFLFSNLSQPENLIAVTGTGGAPRVFSHAASLVVDALHRHRPASLEYSAEEPSRQRLYRHVTKHITQHHPDYVGYEIQVPDPEKPAEFAAVHKDFVSDFQKQHASRGNSLTPLTPKHSKPARYTMTAAEIDRAVKGWVPPSEAQAAAGNYKKPHIHLHGLRIAIENPKGTRRQPAWPPLPAHYGQILGTEDHDGDCLDVFLGPDPASEIAFVVDQEHPSGRWDEHKVVLGCRTAAEAKQLYLDAYTPDWHVGPVTPIAIPQLKAWIASGDQKSRIADQVSKYAAKFDPDQHPRGQPENAGEFATAAGGGNPESDDDDDEYTVGDYYEGPVIDRGAVGQGPRSLTLWRRATAHDTRLDGTDWAIDPDDTRDYDRRGSKDAPGQKRVMHELQFRVQEGDVADEEALKQTAKVAGVNVGDNDPVEWLRSKRILQQLHKAGYKAVRFWDVSPITQYEHQTVRFLPGMDEEIDQPERHTLERQPERYVEHADVPNPGSFDQDTPSDEGYVYHATTLDRANGIHHGGLQTHRPWYGTDQGAWPDGSTERRAYFTPRASSAAQFSPEGDKPILLRVHGTKHAFKRETTGDLYTTKPVHPRHLEALDSEGAWRPLQHFFPERSRLLKPKPPSATEQYQQADGQPERYVEHPATNPDHPDHPAFKKWFGKSKVTHAETGKPLVVYHGTGTPNFDAFDPKKQRQDMSGGGFFFTENPEEASEYAKAFPIDVPAADRRPGVLPVHLKIEHPFERHRFTDEALLKDDAAQQEMRRLEKLRDDMPDATHVELLTAAGYDGMLEQHGKTRHWVAFHPHQIKSATGNRGTFDAVDSRINYRQDGEPERYARNRKPMEGQKSLFGGDDEHQPARQQAQPKSPEFEALHPREADGTFTDKEAWHMTRHDFHQAAKQEHGEKYDAARTNREFWNHVGKALERGEDVPEATAAEYRRVFGRAPTKPGSPPTDDERARYDGYVRFIRENRLQPISIEDWVANYRETQGYRRQEQERAKADEQTAGDDHVPDAGKKAAEDHSGDANKKAVVGKEVEAEEQPQPRTEPPERLTSVDAGEFPHDGEWDEVLAWAHNYGFDQLDETRLPHRGTVENADHLNRRLSEPEWEQFEAAYQEGVAEGKAVDDSDAVADSAPARLESDRRPAEIRQAQAALANVDLGTREGEREAMQAVKDIADEHGVNPNDLWRELMYEPEGADRDIIAALENQEDKYGLEPLDSDCEDPTQAPEEPSDTRRKTQPQPRTKKSRQPRASRPADAIYRAAFVRDFAKSFYTAMHDPQPARYNAGMSEPQAQTPAADGDPLRRAVTEEQAAASRPANQSPSRTCATRNRRRP